MPSSSYQVVTSVVTVPQGTGSDVYESRISVPTGTKPLSGGYYDTDSNLTTLGLAYFTASYPDGQQWVFRIVKNSTGPRSITLYVTAAAV